MSTHAGVESAVDVPIENNQAVVLEQSSQTKQLSGDKSFQEVQLSMQDELEKKRLEWEEQVDKMQQQFFNVKAQGHPENATVKEIQVRPSSPQKPYKADMTSDIIDIANSKNLYTEMPDGSLMYKLRFDLRDYKPQDIKVKQEGNKLSVQARKYDEVGGGTKVTKQFNRQIDIPKDVAADKMSASFTKDGILSVDAPATLAKELEEERKKSDRNKVETRNTEHSSRTTVESEKVLNHYLYPSMRDKKEFLEQVRGTIRDELAEREHLNRYLYPDSPTRREDMNRSNMTRLTESSLLYDIPPPPSRTVHVARKIKKTIPGQSGTVTVLEPTCHHHHGHYGDHVHTCIEHGTASTSDQGGDDVRVYMPSRSSYSSSYTHVPARNILDSEVSSYLTPKSTVFNTEELLSSSSSSSSSNTSKPAERDANEVSRYDDRVHVRYSPPPETYTDKQSVKLSSKTPGGVTIIRAGNNYSGSRFRTGDQRLHIEAPKHILGSFYYCADDDDDMVSKAQNETVQPAAPIKPKYERIYDSEKSGRRSPTFEKVIYARENGEAAPPPPSIKTYTRPLVVHTADGHKMKMALEIGDFSPQDVVLLASKNKLSIEAKFEEMGITRKEFKRSFDLAEQLELNTLRAVLAPGGILMAGSSVKGNLRHEQVLNSILKDFPPESKTCKIIIQR